MKSIPNTEAVLRHRPLTYQIITGVFSQFPGALINYDYKFEPTMTERHTLHVNTETWSFFYSVM